MASLREKEKSTKEEEEEEEEEEKERRDDLYQESSFLESKKVSVSKRVSWLRLLPWPRSSRHFREKKGKFFKRKREREREYKSQSIWRYTADEILENEIADLDDTGCVGCKSRENCRKENSGASAKR